MNLLRGYSLCPTIFQIIILSPALFIMPKPVADATTGGATPRDAGWSGRILHAPMAACYIQRAGGRPRLAGFQEKKWPLLNRNIGVFILNRSRENYLLTIIRHWYNKTTVLVRTAVLYYALLPPTALSKEPGGSTPAGVTFWVLNI